MKALRLYKSFDARLEDVAEPMPDKGWVLVKTLAIGTCSTGKAFYTGSYPLFKSPLVPSHEVVGVAIKQWAS